MGNIVDNKVLNIIYNECGNKDRPSPSHWVGLDQVDICATLILASYSRHFIIIYNNFSPILCFAT